MGFFIKNFLANTKNIILFSAILFSLLVTNYYYNKNLLKTAITAEQLSVLKSTSKRITNWLSERIKSLEAINSLIKNEKLNHKNIEKILAQSQMVTNFTSIYVGYDDNSIISSREFIIPKNYNVKNRPWYVNTMKFEKNYITKPYIDTGLKVPVVALCLMTSNSHNNGVLCGVLSLNDIKKDVLSIDFENKETAFLVDDDMTILLHSKERTTLKKYQADFIKDANNPKNLEFQNNVVSFVNIPHTSWTMVVKSKKDELYAKLNKQFIHYALMYFASFLLLFLIIFIYTYRQKEQILNAQKMKRLLKFFTKNNLDGVLIQNENGKIIFFNKIFIQSFEIQDKDLLLKNSLEILKFLPNETYKQIYNLLKNPAPISKNFGFSIENGKKNERHFNAKIINIFNDNKKFEGAILIFSNITEIYKLKQSDKEKESILFTQSKMAELGSMIGAISHQWRQPLNSLSLFLGNLVQFKQMNKLSDEIFTQNLNRCFDNISFLSRTIDTFRYFYEPRSNIEEFDLIKTINDTIFITFSNPQFYNIDIKIKFNKTKNHTCKNYINEFQQIIACLLSNSKDALKQSEVTQKKIRIFIKTNDDKISVFVCDNGIGVENEFISKLFLPFTSTKNQKGGGNGLYISKLIAKNKLAGDLSLRKSKSPTIFELKFKQRLSSD